MEETFKEAAQTNDQVSVFRKTVYIHEQSDKFNKAEEMYERMVKKFKGNKDIWIEYATFQMKRGGGGCDKARDVIARCLKSVPKNAHLDVMSKSAQLELKFGDPERGKTLYEKLLKSCPRRVDIWGVYVDALVKRGDVEAARAVLDRATQSNLPMKKMKTVFRKYLAFEAQHGTEEQQNAIRAQAESYLNERLE